MSVMDSMQGALEKYISPVAAKLNGSDVVKGMSRGMMHTMPIMLGVCVLAVLVNLPMEGWQAFLTGAGLSAVCNELLAITMNMLALYMVVSIAYSFGKLKGANGVTSALVTLGIFLVLMPLKVEVAERRASYFIDTTYLGSKGIFLAIILGLAVSGAYAWLNKRMNIKLPSSVPTMVVDSLSPTFVAIVMFTGAFLIKWGFTFTPWGNVFDCVNTLLAAPIMNVGSSPLAIIFAYSFSCILWFFGVHPSAIMNVFSPAISVCMLGNLEAFMAGTPVAELPHLAFITIYAVMSLGGSGQLIGLAISMIGAKSARFKSLFKVAAIPSLFNISEPMMFGVPVVLNPAFLVPMVIATPVTGSVAWGLAELGLNASFNPAVMAPWVLPKFVSGFLQGGFGLFVIVALCMVIATAIWYPFFRVADAAALKEEQEALGNVAEAEGK